MTDITKCANKTCVLRNTCYRFKATASKYKQSYADFVYDEGCTYYWPIGKMYTTYNNH
jgi:hypothetical protein